MKGRFSWRWIYAKRSDSVALARTWMMTDTNANCTESHGKNRAIPGTAELVKTIIRENTRQRGVGYSTTRRRSSMTAHTSKFQREFIAERFAIIYCDLLGLGLVFSGSWIHNESVADIGLGLIFGMTVWFATKELIIWAYKKWSPSPEESFR
jgi:hypothetical protein